MSSMREQIMRASSLMVIATAAPAAVAIAGILFKPPRHVDYIAWAA